MSITYLHIADVKIKRDERQRREIKDSQIIDLAQSIKENGLIHAPAVQDDHCTLIAGERRYLAILSILSAGETFMYGQELIEWPNFPAHILASASPEKLFAIELEENLRRVNLTPMEEASAIAKLHHFRTSQKSEPQTLVETATELANLEGREVTSTDQQKVSDSIIVDQFKENPEVQKAAKVSLKRGAKIAKQIMERDFRRALSGLDKEEKGTTEEQSLHTVVYADSLTYVHKLPRNSINVLLFDPPYGIDAHNFGEQKFDLGHEYDDSAEAAEEFTSNMLLCAKDFLVNEGHILQFCAFEFFAQWKEYLSILGYNVWPRPIIWSKGQRSHAPQPDHGPRYSYETIIYARKGKPRIHKLINDVIHVPSVAEKVHAAEKPADLLSQLLDMVATPGDRILDPCCGSGSIFLAASGKELFVEGIEQNEDHYLIAKERANG